MQSQWRAPRLMLLLPLSLLLMALASCTVTIKDDALYMDQGASGATEVHFLTGSQVDLTKDQWDLIRTGMVCMAPQSFGDFKSEIEQLCTIANCDEETQDKIQAFFDSLEIAGGSHGIGTDIGSDRPADSHL